MATPIKTGTTVTAIATANSLTQAVTVVGGSNCLILRTNVEDSSGSGSVSVTYGGTALTLVGSQKLGGNVGRVQIWRLLAPAVGTANLVVTLDGTGTIIMAVIDQYSGVNQTTPTGTVGTRDDINGTTTPSYTVPSVVGDLVIDVLAFYRGEPVVISPSVGAMTEDADFTRADGNLHLVASSQTAAGTTTTVGYTASMSGLNWAIGVALKGVTGGGGAVIPVMLHHYKQQGVA